MHLAYYDSCFNNLNVAHPKFTKIAVNFTIADSD